MGYRIFYEQTDKKTGVCIGQGASVIAYSSVKRAKKDAPSFEFNNEDFIQEIVAIAEHSPFINNPEI